MSNRKPYEGEMLAVFMKHLETTRGVGYEIVREHVPVGGGKNCDYLIAPIGGGQQIAVELTQIVDEPDALKQHHLRGVTWKLLKAALEAAGVDRVIVRTPWLTSAAPRDIENKIAPKLAQDIKAALAANPDADALNVQGYEVERFDHPGVYCSSHSSAHYVNTPKLIGSLMETLVANDPKVAISGAEKVILAVALDTDVEPKRIAYHLAQRIDLDRLLHADRAFFVDRGGGLHVVYAREVRDFLKGSGAYPADWAALTERYLLGRLTQDDPAAVQSVRALRERLGDFRFLALDEARTAVVNSAAKLVERGDIETGMWAVRNFLRDADPAPDNVPSPHSICTVRGTVGWLLHVLSCHATGRDLEEVVAAVAVLANDANEYVREMAGLSLRVLVARADELAEGRRSWALASDCREMIKTVWLSYLRGASTTRVANAAAETLEHAKDLTESEVLEIVSLLAGRLTDNAVHAFVLFLVYFAELRESDPAHSTPFDATRIRQRLEELLADHELREALGFALFKTFERGSAESVVLLPLLVPLLEHAASWRALHFPLECVAHLPAGDLPPGLDAAVLGAVRRCLANGADRYSPYLLKRMAEPAVCRLAELGRTTAASSIVAVMGAAGVSLDLAGASATQARGATPPANGPAAGEATPSGPRN